MKDLRNDLSHEGLRFDATLREVSIRSGAVFRSARVSHVKREGTFWRVAFTDGGMVLARWLRVI
jgi:hypothetical protein